MSWRKSVKRVLAPVGTILPSRTRGTPGAILCYHGIGLRPAPEVVAVDAFCRQLDLLVRRCRVVSVAELVHRVGEPDDGGPLRVAISFDDGYKGVIHHGLTRLRENGLHATAYVLPGLWGHTAPWPSDAPAEERTLWDETDARAWLAGGMGIGSHGLSHRDLSVAPVPVIDEEVSGSMQALEDAFGSVDGFCYPWGRYSPVARQRVEAAGYRYGLAAGYSRHHAREDLYALGRITVDHDDTIGDLQMKLRGGYDWLDNVGLLRSKVGAWRSS